MKKNILILLLLIFSFDGHCDNFGDFASAIWLNNCGSSQFYNTSGSGADCINPTCGTVFNGTNFGSFNQNSGAFAIGGAEYKSWKNASGNNCGGTLYYTVYTTGSRPGSPVFTAMNIPWKCNCSGATFGDGLGPCSGSDQKWSIVSNNVDLTSRAPGNYTLEIYYQYTGGNSAAACDITHYINNGGSATNYTATFQIVASGGTCAILPIELKDFSVDCSDQGTLINWTTSSEINSAYFVIEKSRNALNWDTLAILSSSGNSIDEKKYYYLDPNSSNQLFYYKLSEYNVEGKISFRKLYAMNCQNSANLFYSAPNPSENSEFLIYFKNELFKKEGTLSIYDVKGSLVYYKEVIIQKGTNAYNIDESLSKGLYFVKIEDQYQANETIKHMVK